MLISKLRVQSILVYESVTVFVFFILFNEQTTWLNREPKSWISCTNSHMLILPVRRFSPDFPRIIKLKTNTIQGYY